MSALLIALVLMTPGLAEACSTCLSASDETREAYYASTALMAVLPLAMIGGLGYWLHRVSREERPDEDHDADQRDGPGSD